MIGAWSTSGALIGVSAQPSRSFDSASSHIMVRPVEVAKEHHVSRNGAFNAIKKHGSGKGNWGRPGDELYEETHDSFDDAQEDTLDYTDATDAKTQIQPHD